MIEDELYEAKNEQGITAMIDMREPSLKKAQSPVELLLSSLSACGAVDVVTILKKRRKTIRDLVIEAQGNRRTESPRAFTYIHCHYILTSADVTESELSKAVSLSLEKYCSVAATLKCTIDYSVEIRKPY